jgi:hypothetical protein
MGQPGPAFAGQSPVAAYSFDEGTGTVAGDQTGNHNGTLEGPTWVAKGKYGSALSFDGINDLVSVPDSNELDLTDEFTLEAWVRPAEANEWSAVITKERGSKALSYQLHAEGEKSAPVGYVSNSSGTYGVTGGTAPITPRVWSHLALTYDGAKLRFYVDGVLKGTAAGIDPGVGTDSVLIGDNVSWAAEDAFKGLIDEVRIYDRALDEKELNTDRTTPIQTSARPPVAAYSFDAGEGTTLEDSSGEHDGTVKGAAWTKGKYGSALKFSGSEEECVRIADSPDLRLSEEFTIEAWVRPEGGDTSDPIIFKETGGNFTYALAAGLFHASTPEGAVAYQPNISTETESPTNLTQNAWNHLALTYDGARLRLYQDGALVDTEKSAPAIQTKDPLAIGCSYSWDEGMTGKIDEVRLYDRALDEGELTADKGTPIHTPARPPVAAYSFDEGEGTTLEDVSGEHDGTIEGAAWTKGKYGSALHFDGINDLVRIPDSNDLDLTDEFTLEAWVRADEANPGSAVITKERGSGLISYQMHAEGGAKAPVGYVESSKGRYGVTAGSGPIPVHVWSHLALTYDGAKLRFYVDGVLKGTAAGIDPGVGTDSVLIGGDIHWAAEDAFKGKIDELRIYDRALDQEDLLAQVEGQLPACGASYAYPEGAVRGTRKPLGEGGSVTMYRLGDGLTVELPEPPPGFDPLTATSEERAQYGIPAKPEGGEALEEWEEEMGAYGRATWKGTDALCNTGVESSSTPEGPGQSESEEAGPLSIANWAGFAAFDFQHPSRFVGVQGRYVQPESHPDSCRGSRLVTWVGLGELGPGEGLVQAGTGIDEDNDYFAWFEWIRKGAPRSIQIHRIKPLDGFIHPGDNMYVSLTYSQANHILNFYVANNTRKKAQAVVIKRFPGNVFYDGSSAEWIAERPSVHRIAAPLKNFGSVTWRGARVLENDGDYVKAGNLPRTRINMKIGRRTLASSSPLTPDGKSFTSTWNRCG